MRTPVRQALTSTSFLQQHVRDGLVAMEKAHRRLLDDGVRDAFSDSLDLDKALREEHGAENRWDYLLGHSPSTRLVGLEPHSANTGEVSTVINKKRAARAQLRVHLRSGQNVAAWFWIATGRVDFAPHDKVLYRLNQEGISFVGGALREKHLKHLKPKSAKEL